MQIVSHEWERVFGEVYKSISHANQQRRYLRWTHADGMMVFDPDSGTWIKGSEQIEEMFGDELANAVDRTPLQLLQWYVGGEMTQKGMSPDGYQHPSILHLEDFQPYLREDPNPHPIEMRLSGGCVKQHEWTTHPKRFTNVQSFLETPLLTILKSWKRSSLLSIWTILRSRLCGQSSTKP